MGGLYKKHMIKLRKWQKVDNLERYYKREIWMDGMLKWHLLFDVDKDLIRRTIGYRVFNLCWKIKNFRYGKEVK